MTTVQTAVPVNESSATVCQYCGTPFPTDTRLALHRGLKHWPELTETERDAFRAAQADERDALRSFRVRALAWIVILYFGFLFLYAIFAI